MTSNTGKVPIEGLLVMLVVYSLIGSWLASYVFDLAYMIEFQDLGLGFIVKLGARINSFFHGSEIGFGIAFGVLLSLITGPTVFRKNLVD